MNKTLVFSLGALAILASGCAPNNDPNIKPEFDYFYTGPNDRAPLSVTFTNNSQGADSYHWNFGDGGSRQRRSLYTFFRQQVLIRLH